MKCVNIKYIIFIYISLFSNDILTQNTIFDTPSDRIDFYENRIVVKKTTISKNIYIPQKHTLLTNDFNRSIILKKHEDFIWLNEKKKIEKKIIQSICNELFFIKQSNLFLPKEFIHTFNFSATNGQLFLFSNWCIYF